MRKALTLIEALVAIAVVAVVIVVLLIGMLLPHYDSRHEARKAACQGNLYNLGLSYAMYRMDYGKYPQSRNGDYRQRSDESIALLYPLYLEAIDTLVCPGVKRRGAEYVNDPADHRMLSGQPIIVGGDYTQDDVIPLNSSPGRVVMADRHDDGQNHKGSANCLFKDGHVKVTSGSVSDTDFPNPEYPNADPRIYRDDGLGPDDASIEE